MFLQHREICSRTYKTKWKTVLQWSENRRCCRLRMFEIYVNIPRELAHTSPKKSKSLNAAGMCVRVIVLRYPPLGLNCCLCGLNCCLCSSILQSCTTTSVHLLVFYLVPLLLQGCRLLMQLLFPTPCDCGLPSLYLDTPPTAHAQSWYCINKPYVPQLQ